MTSYVGTAGWTIPSRYVGEMPTEGSHLERYARRLPGVEINSSFYRSHQVKTYERWAASVPQGFRFAVKIPRTISHESALVDCGALTARFGEEVNGLGAALGVLLLQLPPSLAFDPILIDAFVSDLRARVPVPIACEPRHDSWFTPECDAYLRGLGVARVAADPARAPGGDAPGGWDGLVYYRLHGSPRVYYSEYPEPTLDAMRDVLAAEVARGVPAWCIFDNTAAFAALGNALAVAPVAG